MVRYPLKRIRRWKRRRQTQIQFSLQWYNAAAPQKIQSARQVARLIAGKILFLILEQKLVVFVASVYKKHRVGQLPDFVQRRFFLFSAVP